MSVYGKINVNDFTLVDSKFHKTKLLDNNSVGISRVTALSQSFDNKITHAYPINDNANHWRSLRVLYYSSSYSPNQFIDRNLSLFNTSPKQDTHTHKFYDTASVFYIPQSYFGEEIQKGSLTLTDSATSIKLKDDGEGNLYAVDPVMSQSKESSISSSDNYIGNVFYDSGVVTVTDTGSFDSTHKYQDFATGSYSVQFNSTQTFYIRQWSINIKPNTYMRTMNPTSRGLVSGSATIGGKVHWHSPHIKNALTASNWSPYVTQIALYNDTEVHQVYGENGEVELKTSEPIVVANLPRAVQMRDDISIIFKIKLDY
tara:strand:+ start:22514 stop:23455 length:942 start_codon:yes stop_codon:yes gene_type:complete